MKKFEDGHKFTIHHGGTNVAFISLINPYLILFELCDMQESDPLEWPLDQQLDLLAYWFGLMDSLIQSSVPDKDLDLGDGIQKSLREAANKLRHQGLLSQIKNWGR